MTAKEFSSSRPTCKTVATAVMAKTSPQGIKKVLLYRTIYIRFIAYDSQWLDFHNTCALYIYIISKTIATA